MKNTLNIHGLVSLLLIIDAFGVALFSIGSQSSLIAIAFLLLFIGYFALVSVVYCSKCLYRNNCNHLIIGRLSMLLTKRKSGPYTKNDILFGVILPFIPLLVIPQFYLIQNILHLAIFWLFFGLACFEIYFFVCKTCNNSNCMMCKHRYGTNP